MTISPLAKITIVNQGMQREFEQIQRRASQRIYDQKIVNASHYVAPSQENQAQMQQSYESHWKTMNEKKK